jgi:hypothetical protein
MLLIIVTIVQESERSQSRAVISQADICQTNDRVHADDWHSLRILQEGIKKEPSNFWFWKRLCLRQAAIDIETAIQTCTAANKDAFCLEPSLLLPNLYAAKGDYIRAIKIMLYLQINILHQPQRCPKLFQSQSLWDAQGNPTEGERQAFNEYITQILLKRSN